MHKKKLISMLLIFSIIINLFPVTLSKAADYTFDEAVDLAAREYVSLLGGTESAMKSKLNNSDRTIFNKYKMFVDSTKQRNYGKRVDGEWEILGTCPITGEEVPNHLYPPQYDGSFIDNWKWLSFNNPDDRNKIISKTIFKDLTFSRYLSSNYLENAKTALMDEGDNYSNYSIADVENFVLRLSDIMYVTVPPTQYSRGVGLLFHELSDGRVWYITIHLASNSETESVDHPSLVFYNIKITGERGRVTGM